MLVATTLGLAACAGTPREPGHASSTPAEGAAGVGGTTEPKRSAQIERVTLASGLVIEDLGVGTGEMCLPGSWMRVRYVGTLPDGRVADSSGGETLLLHLPRMIRGWQDGLPGMRVGGKRRLTVPSDLGYGSRDMKDSAGAVVIPAGSTLVYEVDLLGIEQRSGG
jgi:FKBP-type peptidyl-prolyl cis-trans isomerase